MEEHVKKSIASSVVLIFIVTLFTYIVGFLVQIVIAHTLGVGSELDAFVIASLIPEFIFGLTNAVFLTTFIVVFSEYLKKGGNATTFLSSIGAWLSLFLLLIMLFILFFAEGIVNIIAPGFRGQQFELTVTLVRILSLSIFFYGISSFITGVLMYEHHFLVPKAAKILMSLVLIPLVLISETKVQMLAIGTVFGIALVVLVEFLVVKKKGYSFSFALDKETYPAAKEMLLLSTPLMLSSVLYYVTKTIMNLVATTQGVGSVSILNYAFLLATVPVIFFSGSIASILYPHITKSYVHEKEQEANTLFLRSLSFLILVFIPFTILFYFMSTDIVRIFFERGAFTAASTTAVGTALHYYAIGMIPSGIWASILSLLCAKKKVWEQFFLYVIFFSIIALGMFLFLDIYSYNAIPVAWSIAYWITALLGLIYVKTFGVLLKPLWSTMKNGLFATLGMIAPLGLFTFFRPIIPFLNTPFIIFFIILGSMGAYVFILKVIHAKELELAWKYLKRLGEL